MKASVARHEIGRITCRLGWNRQSRHPHLRRAVLQAVEQERQEAEMEEPWPRTSDDEEGADQPRALLARSVLPGRLINATYRHERFERKKVNATALRNANYPEYNVAVGRYQRSQWAKSTRCWCPLTYFYERSPQTGRGSFRTWRLHISHSRGEPPESLAEILRTLL